MPMKLSITETAELCNKVICQVSMAVIGKENVHKYIMAAFLCPGGHILLEDYPGLGKTLLASSFARILGMSYKRIQFTPDLLPGDITGGYVFDSTQNRFTIRKGPVFCNILLADEINRASPKTQSALLEAMQENQVTLEGETTRLPQPFIVIATQNPVEYEGTFPLPEAQLDRFIIRLSLGYPSIEEEREILRRRVERKQDNIVLEQVLNPVLLVSMRDAVEEVFIDPDIIAYITNLVNKSRNHSQVLVGSSPRGSMALLKMSRAWAAIHGRDYVIPDDVKIFCEGVLAHRLIMNQNLWDVRDADRKTVREIEQSVKVPVFAGNDAL